MSASGPDDALAIRQHEENPRTQTSVALRVQGGPWPCRVSAPRFWSHPAEHRSRRCAAARTPGRQFTHTGASRGLTPFSADAVTEPDSLAPGFGPRGYGVATGDAQGDRTRDSQRLSAAPRSPAGTRAYIRSPASCPNPIGPGTGGASTGGR